MQVKISVKHQFFHPAVIFASRTARVMSVNLSQYLAIG